VTIGWEEILLLMVFALIIFGPKRLPEIARQVGRFVGEIRRLSQEFEREVRDVTDPFHRELTAATNPEDAQMRAAEAEAGIDQTYDMDEHHSTFRPPDPPAPPAP
jgi:sec-independent protein translocase protein TatB